MVAGSVFSHARLFTGAPKARVFAFNERRAFQRGRERGVHGASVRGSGRAIMAEVATKKSINVVSSKKSEVCSVQSNNGLIELDNLTAGNKQLISLCDTNDDEDDLILTNNTRNELDSDDKSLQELIESELALRICSNNEPQASIHDADMEQVEEEGEEEEEDTTNEPETVKRILLDRQQDIVDANSEFIAAESEHSALIEKSYNYQNGHVSPDTKICYEEEVKPEPIMVAIRDEQEQEVEEEQVFDEQPEVGSTIVVQETTTIEMDRSAARDSSDDDKPFRQNEDNEDNEDPSPSYPVCRPAEVEDRPPEVSSMIVESFEPSCENEQEDRVTTMPVVYGDKYQEEREVEDTVLEEHLDQTEAGATTESDPMKIEQLDNWTEQSAFVENQQTGQFSDNFDQTLCQEGIELCSTDQQLVKESSLRENSKLEASLRSKCNKEDLKEESKVSKTEEKIPSNVAEEPEEPEEEAPGSPVQSRSFDDGAMSRSESSADAISTQEFIDTERRVLSEENEDQQIVQEEVQPPSTEKIEPPIEEEEEVEGKEEINDNTDEQNAIAESSSELSVSEPTFIEKTEVVISESNVTIFSETRCLETENESEALIEEQIQSEQQLDSGSSLRAPLATPDDEISDVSNACDSESREETITTSTTVTSPGTKVGTKTKKKKIEGVAGNDASPNLTPRTKKTKKSKKSELEKENISVNCNMQESSMHPGSRQMHPETLDFSDEDDLSNVNVKSLTQTYVSETSRNEQDRCSKEKIATGVSIKQLKARSLGDLRLCEKGYSKFTKDALVFVGVSVKALRASYCSLANLTSQGKDMDRPRFEKSSFNKFDALSKKTVLHVRSIDAGKVQQQLNAVGQNGDTNANCRSCGKVVFQMEQTKAEGLVWHKNCFRCVQCSKQLNVDNYESHESTLYCKPHFKELFQPKPVEESEQPVRPRKPELIIRENEPKELPPDVVRASDKPDLGLEELSSLNVKSRFQVFEKAGTETNEIERSPSQIAVKRSPSILSKLAKFQAKGMDIGVADESLNGIPYEESSESEEEEETEETEEVDSEIVKAKRTTRERPISFTKMDDIKNRWETTSQQGRKEVQREARKEEIAGIRSRLFMGKQGKMKEMYQQAVAGSERVTKINAAEELQHSSTHARSIKERFERGEPIATSDDETDGKPKPEKADEEVIAAGISRKSRSMFLELDASAAKTGRPVTPVNPKTPAEAPRRARDAFMGRQVSDDVVRSSDTTEEVHAETSDISNKFKFFESYKEPEKQRKQFRITPPRDGQLKMDSPEREIYRDPDVVRAEDRVDEVVHTDTARKMLSIFRQMEENACKQELPNGPKPLKRFTPPPEDKYAKPTASDSEEEEEEEGEESDGEDSGGEERDPNYVRASDKVEDEFLKQAQNAARAKTLCAKFEHWEETDAKTTMSSSQNIAEMEIAQNTGDQSSIESASSLRARFESLGSQTSESPRTPKVKVNRFVEIQASCTDVCESCEKKVYPLEKVETNNKIFHKQCFRCLQCNCVLRMDTFTLNNGKLYCIPHFKQLFITRGNYDEGFGVDPHKNKWSSSSSNPTSPSPIAVSNGDL
ncbi:xin actin-binding repeat-containing protein 2 isoform X3 [Osmia bicornis bicornis]|uniref:xin actin-binding repeat-containing protein 2 isoform X3 n=1 Tax=Osmia bicornis bicornis TaxID=1437191 RepID=UPI001EAF6604|nr:xin actin-binding repeat-containing protein 2 isoform X3 [Osmia bicornis bicornis]